jgi:cell division protein FtsL
MDIKKTWKNHEDDPAEQMRRTVLAQARDIETLKQQIQDEVKEKYSLYQRIKDLTTANNK